MLFFSFFVWCFWISVYLLIEVIAVMILSHFPPFHVHSIMSLMGVNVLIHAHLLIAMPLLPIEHPVVPLSWIQGSHPRILMAVHTSPFWFFCGGCFLRFWLLLQSKLYQIRTLHTDLHTDWLFAFLLVMLQPLSLLFFWFYFPPSPFAFLYCVFLLLFFIRFPNTQ